MSLSASLARFARRWASGGQPPSEWQRYAGPFFHPLVARDGSSLDGELHVMRRYVRGEWEYRHETEAETQEREDDMAW